MKKLLSLLIIILTIPFSAYTQKLKASVDRVLHTSDVREMIISPNRKLFATSDNSGTVVMRDILTGKAFGHYNFKGDVIDIFFSKNIGQIIAVATDPDNGDAITLHIYDFINQKMIHEKVLSQHIDDPELDFNSEENLLALSHHGGVLILYNIEDKIKTQVNLELEYSIVGFGKENQIEIINCDGDWTEGFYYHYNYISKKLIPIENKILYPSYLEFDMNNKNMFRKKGIMTLCDNLIDICIDIPESDFYYSDLRNTGDISPLTWNSIKVITIEDFAFSEDGQYLAFVGGEEPLEDSNFTNGIDKNVGSGFVAMYSIKDSKMLWKTKGKKKQTKYITNDLDWIDNENIVTSDALGNTIFYHISDSLFQRSYLLPQRFETNIKIDGNFNNIIYAMQEHGVREFECNNPENNQTVFDNDTLSLLKFSNHYDVLKNKSIALSTNNNALDQIISKATISDISQNDDGGIIALSLQLFDQIKIETINKSIDGKKTIYTCNGINIFSLENNLKVGEMYPESVDETYFVLIYDKNNARNSYLTPVPEFTEIQLSQNDQFIEFTNFETEYPFYEVGKNNEGLKLAFDQYIKTILDKSSEYALSVDASKKITIWNTSTNRKIGSHNFHSDFDDIAINIDEFKIDLKNNTAYYSFANNIIKFNYETNDIEEIQIDVEFSNFDFSPDYNYLYLNEWDFNNNNFWITLLSLKTKNTIYREAITLTVNDKKSGENYYFPAYFHDWKPLVFIPDNFGELKLIDLTHEKTIGTLKFFPNGEWLVYTPNGIFDGSKNGRKALYYLSGPEVILYDQLKDTYWESNLLDKLINAPELIQNTELSQDVELEPLAKIFLSDTKKGIVSIELTQRNGGIGRVSLYINDKEIAEDINANRKDKFSITLENYKAWLYTAGTNKIGIKVYNQGGWLKSTQHTLFIDTQLDKDKGDENNDPFANSTQRTRNSNVEKPGLYGLFVGTSSYANKSLDLKFADKDALLLNDAFTKISKDMYDKDRVKLKILTTQSKNAEGRPSKKNIIEAFEEIAKEARPEDIIILFFSGHGMTIEDDFYYLTSLAGNIDIKQNKAKRDEICISSEEIRQALKNIKSNKQIMIFDACHSGAIAKILSKDNSKALSTSQQKALEALKDKTGVFILASSESNQKSFETQVLQHGLLTFSLLRGLSGKAAEGDLIHAIDLLSFAARDSEEIGRRILGRNQHPVFDVGESANSYPIGFKSQDIKELVPMAKHKVCKPTLVNPILYHDPENIVEKLSDYLKERGALGAKENFVFVTNPKDAYTIAGSYITKGNQIIINWNILKNNSVYKGPFETTDNLTNEKTLMNKIINTLLLEIE